LKNLRTDRVDSYLLHGPYSYPGLGNEDWEVWTAIEEIYRSGRAGMIGISKFVLGNETLAVAIWWAYAASLLLITAGFFAGRTVSTVSAASATPAA